jgi:hypothetical protein
MSLKEALAKALSEHTNTAQAPAVETGKEKVVEKTQEAPKEIKEKVTTTHHTENKEEEKKRKEIAEDVLRKLIEE